MSDLTIRKTEIADRIGDVLDVLADPKAPPEEKAAAYAIGYAIQREMNRRLGIRQKGATPQHELTEHMVRNDIKAIGPLYLAWEAFDVKYPVNGSDNWTDAGVQDDLGAIRADPATREYIREVPAHLEVDVPALGEAVHAGSAAAKALYDYLKAKRYRIEGGKRPVLKVREAKPPKATEGEAA